MQRSSETISTLAAALAKAQVELTNPEKSLVATLPAERGQSERSFRYASLAAGLDIVRKTLGRHELATIQSTAVDRDSGTIRLTTTLAHASGEWIASEWPVCMLADLPAPHRMGAALSYARRYGLFTLVGIAGEDDLDAPDLAARSSALKPASSPSSNGSIRSTKPQPPAAAVMLDPDGSQKVCDELLAELSSAGTLDQIAEWAKRSVAIKNTLTAEHARAVEAAFELNTQRLNAIEAASSPSTYGHAHQQQTPPPDERDGRRGTKDWSGLAFGHTPRRRNKAHLKFVASQPCLLCNRRPTDPHHLRFAQPVAMGRKVSDEFTVPLCRTHHRQLHRSGNEIQWWKIVNGDIDPLEVARKLWDQSHAQSQ